MGCAPSSRAVSSCLVKRPLPITLLPFLPPNSASRRSRSLEVGQRGGVGGAGPEATAESGLESQLPLFLPGSKAGVLDWVPQEADSKMGLDVHVINKGQHLGGEACRGFWGRLGELPDPTQVQV